MLPCARQVYKFEVDHFCAMLFGKLQYLFGGHVLCFSSCPATMLVGIASLHYRLSIF